MSQAVLACTAVSVTTSNTPVVAARASGRRSLTIVNDGSNVVYLALTTTPGTLPTGAANSGVRLSASGGSLTIDNYAGAVNAIASGGTSVVTVLEV